MNKWIVLGLAALFCITPFSAVAASTETTQIGIVLAISQQQEVAGTANSGGRGAAIGAAVGGLLAYKTGGTSYRGGSYGRGSVGALIGGAVGAAVDRRSRHRGYSVVIQNEGGQLVTITTAARPAVAPGNLVFFTRSGVITLAPEVGGRQ